MRISPVLARRLAIASQQLAGSEWIGGKPALLSVIKELGCLQIDPINVVARSPLLVLWSRLGNYDPADLGTLLWQDKVLFEYWAHAASIVLSDDYPLYQRRMRNFARGDSRWEQRVWNWLEANDHCRQTILQQLDQRGPLFAEEIEMPPGVVPWQSSGWTDSRSKGVMLTFLWEKGRITVAQRQGDGFGLRKQWALSESQFPQWSSSEPWTEHDVVYQAAQRSLQSLGVGTADHIRNHFIRGRYPQLEKVLAELEAAGQVIRVEIVEGDQVWPETWYVHRQRLELLERLSRGEWQPRTTLLSPFDNLICDRRRAERLFRFQYRSENYTPRAKRKYGYYVMPILCGDRLVGRLDPKLDRRRRQLRIQAMHFEPQVSISSELSAAVEGAIEALAAFLGAATVRMDA